MEDKHLFNITGVCHIEKDFELVKVLMTSKKSRYFGPPSREIHSAKDFFRGYATHRMIVRESEDAVRCIGYAQFMHYPKIEALPKECWQDWLNLHYCAPNNAQMTQSNTLFLNHFIYSIEHNPNLLLSVLNECFLREQKVRFIAVVQMPECPQNLEFCDQPVYDCLEPYAKIIYPREFSVMQCKNTQRIYVIYRDTVVNKMRYRKALPEDNDDIVEVIDFDRPDLREEYGDYYIAEELLKDDRDDHNVFIVTEINHQTIGFIWLNDEVDIMKLVKNFELESFGNLIKHSHHENTQEKRITVTGVEKTPDFKLFTQDAIQNIFDESFFGKLLYKIRASGLSLSSKANLHVISHHGLIQTSNERFYLREESICKMQKINNKLRSSKYYHVQFKKSLRILYNVPDEHNYPSNSQYPPDAHSNVFAVQLFGIHIANDERRLFRFLATAFSAFPDRDYCIISIPSSSKITRCLYEILKCFMPVVPRPNGVISDHLYITHRSVIYGDLTVQPVRAEDADYLESMLIADKRALNRSASHVCVSVRSSTAVIDVPPETLVEAETVRNILEDVLHNPDTEFTFLTIRCGNALRPVDDNTIIGYCILRRFMKLHKLWKFFEVANVEPYLQFRNAEVIVLKVHPLYTYHSDLMFRELARISGYCQFYYIAPTSGSRKAFTNDLAKNMEPIEPRYIRQFHRPPQEADDTADSGLVPRIDFDRNSYAVYYHNLKPSRFFGNKDQIIIHGFSDMTKAFVRLLIFNFNAFSEKYSFNCVPHSKVIIIAKPGEVEAEYDSHLTCNMCEEPRSCWLNFQNCNNYIRDTVRRVELRKWVNFISGTVKAIDRKRKVVITDNDCEMYYDKLLLARTTDFGVPACCSETDLPPNYCTVNNRLDKIILFHRVLTLKEDKNNSNGDISIIVYGAHLRAFEFVNFILLHGIKAKSIKLVLPFAPAERDLHMRFNVTYADLKVEEILLEMVEDLGVTVYERMTLTRWVTYPNDENISHAVFEAFPDRSEVVLECDLFVSYFERNIEQSTLDLYTRSGLATKDGCIEVDDNFRTSDRSIYAMGRSVMHSVLPNHQYTFVAPQERAEKLLRILKLDMHHRTNTEEKYSRPAFFQAQLPMGYYLTKVTLPKRYLENHLGNDYGNGMVTYDGNFSRVRLNEHGIVEEIVCVTRTYENFDHLQAFVGKHESMLNDLRGRWYLGEISSFVKFFQEPWTELIMHSHFNELHKKITEMCQETANDIWEENPDMDRKQRKDYMKKYLHNSGATADVERKLLEFLRKYRNDFVHPFALPENFPSSYPHGHI